MNKQFLEQFINEIEKLTEDSNQKEQTSNIDKTYSNTSEIKYCVLEAKELILYGEYAIALENILTNLYEISVILDERMINLACLAFGEAITSQQQLILDALTKKLESS